MVVLEWALADGHVDFNAETTSMLELGCLVEKRFLNQQLMLKIRDVKNIDSLLSDTLESQELSVICVGQSCSSGHVFRSSAIGGVLMVANVQNLSYRDGRFDTCRVGFMA